MKAATLARLLYRRFVDKDQEAGLYLLHKLGRVLIPGYRFSYPQIGWWHDEAFNEYLRRFEELDGMNSDRRWMVYQLCRLTRDIPGDTAECGVFRGASSYLICLANQGLPREHHVFDSFEGLSSPGPRDGDYWKAGALSWPLDAVQRELRRFPDIRYYKGWIPERFGEIAERAFSFVHVDVDLEQPTLDSVAFFYPRLSPGGILLCDDYGFTSCPGATAPIDEFFADKSEKVIALSGGGGFVIKGSTAGPAFEAMDAEGQ